MLTYKQREEPGSVYLLWRLFHDGSCDLGFGDRSREYTEALYPGCFRVCSRGDRFCNGYKELWRASRLWLIGSILFIAFSISAIVNSASPLVQNIYGTYGRNTGLLLI
jgi:hypothetical protein